MSNCAAAVPVKKKRKLSVDAVLGISVGTPELDRLWNIAPDNVSRKYGDFVHTSISFVKTT